MTARESGGDPTESGDETEAPNGEPKSGERSAGRPTDGMFVEIAGNGDGYIKLGAGTVTGAVLAVLGAVVIVAILAHPRLPRAAISGILGRDGVHGDERTDEEHEAGDGTVESARPRFASDDHGS